MENTYEKIYGKELLDALKTSKSLCDLIPILGEDEIWEEMKEEKGWKYHTQKRRKIVREIAKQRTKEGKYGYKIRKARK
ncbi:Uncharacterised protein [Candidatus Anstonella stagnisolia]|nr:Uncharacterised protein [Candidatus Anstonella stagnisolia]